MTDWRDMVGSVQHCDAQIISVREVNRCPAQWLCVFENGMLLRVQYRSGYLRALCENGDAVFKICLSSKRDSSLSNITMLEVLSSYFPLSSATLYRISGEPISLQEFGSRRDYTTIHAHEQRRLFAE
jgi:hypothetical protein